MSNPNEIEVGDMVRVVFVYHSPEEFDGVEGVVLYRPCATGDSWHIRETGDGTLHYVQTFAEIVLRAKRKEQP